MQISKNSAAGPAVTGIEEGEGQGFDHHAFSDASVEVDAFLKTVDSRPTILFAPRPVLR
ncbi:hypothetical protein ACE0DR_01455 [Azotobacter sp. CWF10]